MTPRSIRRAIERKAQKQARKEVLQNSTPETPTREPKEISESQLAANRQNALLSTGPATPEGKSRASRNALKTGLTGRTVLLSPEEAAPYEHHLQRFFEELRPLGDRETELVQSIADTQWRLARIPSLEMGIYALGRIQFADSFADRDPREAAALIDVQTHLAYQKQLNNLSIQESRLRRQYEKDTAELKQLQQLRLQSERSTRKAAAAAAAQPSATIPINPRPETNGFEFSTTDLALLADHRALDVELSNLGKAA